MALRLLVVVSLLFAALGLGYVAFEAMQPPRRVVATDSAAPPPPPPLMVRVMAAAHMVPAGTLLKDEDFTIREFASGAVPEDALPATDENRAELRGAMLRRYLDASAVLKRSDVLRLRDRGFLAAVLKQGMRAISIGVDAVTGTAGLIWPGDNVDLILTQEFSAEAATLGRRISGETVLTDIRVIAVDQQVSQGVSGSAAGRLARTVTLEVSAEQAERVAVAERLGRLALTVRAIEPAAAPAPEAPASGPIFGADVSAGLSGVAPAGTRLRLIQGADQQEVVFR
jgi:pilus assembly protein CpaB